jgi:hypothetical protein
MQWGQMEILAFGDVRKRWIINHSGKIFATPGLHLRLTEGEFVVHVLCVSENEFKAWFPGEQEPDVVYPTYGLAVCGAFGLGVNNVKRIGFVYWVFTSILNHFVVGTPRKSNERFHITANREGLTPPPIDNAMANDVPDSKKKRAAEIDDGNFEYDLDGNGQDSFQVNELQQRQVDLKSGK